LIQGFFFGFRIAAIGGTNILPEKIAVEKSERFGHTVKCHFGHGYSLWPLRLDPHPATFVESTSPLIAGGYVEGKSNRSACAGPLFHCVHQGAADALSAKFPVNCHRQEIKITSRYCLKRSHHGCKKQVDDRHSSIDRISPPRKLLDWRSAIQSNQDPFPRGVFFRFGIQEVMGLYR
jgi:hypothetical protein